MKKVSIIVPVYNVEKELSRCLDSLVNQTFQDIEILVINDGSPDNSQAIIDEYVNKYPNLIKSFIKENGGLSNTRNYGIRHASGEYVTFIDSDDTVNHSYVETLYNAIVATGADMATCGYKVLVEGIGVVHDSIADSGFGNENILTYEGDSIIRETLLQKKIRNFTGTRLCKKNLIPTFPENVAYEDIITTTELALNVSKVVCVNESLYDYRIRQDSLSTTITVSNLNDFADAIRKRYELIREHCPHVQKYNMYAFIQSTIAISARDVLLTEPFSGVKQKVDENIKIIKEYTSDAKQKEELFELLSDFEKACIYLMKSDKTMYYYMLIEKRRLRKEKENQENEAKKKNNQ